MLPRVVRKAVQKIKRDKDMRNEIEEKQTEEEEDDFMRFYRQHRGSHLDRSGSYQGSQASTSSMLGERDSIASTSRSCSFRSQRILPNGTARPYARSVHGFRPAEAQVYPRNRGSIRSMGSSNERDYYSNRHLYELKGLLQDKLRNRDDAMSRDSGHSSAESPPRLRKRNSCQGEWTETQRLSEYQNGRLSDHQSARISDYANTRTSDYHSARLPDYQNTRMSDYRDPRLSDYPNPRMSDWSQHRQSDSLSDKFSLFSYDNTIRDETSSLTHDSGFRPSYPNTDETSSLTVRPSYLNTIMSDYPDYDLISMRSRVSTDSSRLPSDSMSVQSSPPDSWSSMQRSQKARLNEDYLPGHLKKTEPPPMKTSKARTIISVLLLGLWRIVRTLVMATSCFMLLVLCYSLFRSYSCDVHRHSHFDMVTLAGTLNASLFGQHIATGEIIDALNSFEKTHPPVLVLLLAGAIGSGKTFTTSLLQSHFPVPGNVHQFSVPLHFESPHNVNVLDDLSTLITRSCGYSAVVFDDLESGSSSNPTVDGIVQFIESLSTLRNNNGTLVLITTTDGSQDINDWLLRKLKTDFPPRETLSAASVADVVRQRIPLYGVLRDKGVNVRVIPYLPMMRDQVRQCIENEFHQQHTSPTTQDVAKILDDTPFFSDDFPIFAKHGCKMVASRVDILLGERKNNIME